MEIVDRDSGTSLPPPRIIKVEYPPHILKELKRLTDSKEAEMTRKLSIRRLIGTKSCCICQGIPEIEVIYPLGDATKIERYCHNCYNKREETDSKYTDPNDYFVLATKL
jgi:hypothetical protein